MNHFKKLTISTVLSSICALTAFSANAQYNDDFLKNGTAPAVNTPRPDNTIAPPVRGEYKSVDKSGRTVYSDYNNLGGSQISQHLAPRSGIESDRPVTGSVGKRSGVNAESNLEEFAKKAQSEINENRKAVDEANNRIKEQNCKSAKTALISLESGRRVARIDADGKHVYLEGDQIESEKSRAQKLVEENC